MRALRRHHDERMKSKVRRLVRTWWRGMWGLADDPEFIGRMAQCHGTHDCFMCKAEKYLGKPKVRRVSTRIFEI